MLRGAHRRHQPCVHRCAPSSQSRSRPPTRGGLRRWPAHACSRSRRAPAGLRGQRPSAPPRSSPRALILWVTEAMPIAITALLAIVLQPVLGLAPLPAAFTNFISPVFFFVLVMFVIAQAFTNTGLDRRFACWLLAKADGSTHRTLLLSWWARPRSRRSCPTCRARRSSWRWPWACSTRWASCPGSRGSRKAVMIGIPIASLIGGVGTPAGSSVNVLGPGLHRAVRPGARAVRALDGHRHPDGRHPGAVRGEGDPLVLSARAGAHRGHRLPRRARRAWARSPPASGRSSR